MNASIYQGLSASQASLKILLVLGVGDNDYSACIGSTPVKSDNIYTLVERLLMLGVRIPCSS